MAISILTFATGAKTDVGKDTHDHLRDWVRVDNEREPRDPSETVIDDPSVKECRNG